MTNSVHMHVMVMDTIDTVEAVTFSTVRTHSLQPTTLTKDTLLVISSKYNGTATELPTVNMEASHYHTYRLQHCIFTVIH